MTVNELAIKYKETKDIQYRDELIKQLWKTIKYKASYTYYRKKFRLRNIIFNLYDSQLIEIEDVQHELYLFTIELLETFDGERDFKKYYFTSIWNWKPKFLNKEMYLKLKSSKLVDEDGNDALERVEFPDQDDSYMYVDDILSFAKTKEEKQVLRLMYLNPTLKFTDIATRLGYSPSKITRIVAGMMKNNELKTFIHSLQ